jgi:hypothetical protein
VPNPELFAQLRAAPCTQARRPSYNLFCAHLHTCTHSRSPSSLPALTCSQEANASSRAAVESLQPLTRDGRRQLDAVPDVREALLAADELRLDELLALECLIAGKDAVGEVSAAAAAAVYFEERHSLLACLHLLLQTQIMPPEGLSTGLYEAVCAFNGELLGARDSGRGLLVQRIAEILQSNPLYPGPQSQLRKVLDMHGRAVDRACLVDREQEVRHCEENQCGLVVWLVGEAGMFGVAKQVLALAPIVF